VSQELLEDGIERENNEVKFRFRFWNVSLLRCCKLMQQSIRIEQAFSSDHRGSCHRDWRYRQLLEWVLRQMEAILNSRKVRVEVPNFVQFQQFQK
jgi:hypothetical protein